MGKVHAYDLSFLSEQEGNAVLEHLTRTYLQAVAGPPEPQVKTVTITADMWSVCQRIAGAHAEVTPSRSMLADCRRVLGDVQ